MALTKKLQKFGGSYGALLPVDTIAQMGIDPTDEKGRLLTFELYGETLLIRRQSSARPTLQEIARLLGVGIEEAANLPKRLSLPETPSDLKLVLELLEFAPRTAYEVSQSLRVSKESAEKKLNKAVSKNLAVKDGNRYSLNGKLF